MSEVYVPYGLQDPNWSWRTAMDIGEYNLGQYAEPLRKNVDVPETAEFFDEVAASDTGSVDGAFALPNAAAVYERDSATLWDRTDPTFFDRDARFGRELVVVAAYVIGSYTYMTEYAFRQDGTIAVDVGSMGTTLNRGVKNAAEGNTSGALVAPNIAAPDHQHFFNFRIDFDIDGTANTRARRATGCRRSCHPPRASTAGTSSRGTPRASPTTRTRRSSRPCRTRGSASGSRRTASSIATRRSTCPISEAADQGRESSPSRRSSRRRATNVNASQPIAQMPAPTSMYFVRSVIAPLSRRWWGASTSQTYQGV